MSPWISLLVFVLVGLAIATSALAAHLLAGSYERQQRLAFHSQAAAIAASLRLELQHEQDLELSAGAFMVGHPGANEAQFQQWAQAEQMATRYPELFGIVWINYILRSQMSAMERRDAPRLGRELASLEFAKLESANLPYYCLSSLADGPNPVIILPNSGSELSGDLCLGYPLYASRASGRTLVLAVNTGSFEEMGLTTPVYSRGVAPTTPSARERAFLGWMAMSVQPTVVLKAALHGHPHTAVVLRRTTGTGTKIAFRAGRAPRGGQRGTINLHDGTTLQVIGAGAASGIFADTTAFAVLSGGTVVSLLGGLLLLVVASGAARARRLVAQRTRELAEEAARSAQARDEAVAASNAKSVFVATISHELRTPLAGVIGTTELLLDTELDAEQLEYAEIVNTSSEGLLLVINDILDFSKIEAGKLDINPERFVLAEMIAEAVALMLPVARRKGIALEVELDPKLPRWLNGDAGRLRQVLMNLLSNAVKFTDDGGVIVRASAIIAEASARVHLAVQDTGTGIAPDTLARLFQPFTQGDSSTARRYGGTGLGLTISANLIELMGGQIGVESTPGEGSTFWFEVTLALAEHEPIEEPRRREFVARGERDADGKLTEAAPLVLVAEDNTVNQMLATRLLDKCGYRSHAVTNGLEALAALEHGKYDAVVMDCQMPELDGYEATRELRRREQASGTHLPVIATTAHSLAGDREKCVAAGMDYYLSKPLRAHELTDVLAQALGRSTKRSVKRSRR